LPETSLSEREGYLEGDLANAQNIGWFVVDKVDEQTIQVILDKAEKMFSGAKATLDKDRVGFVDGRAKGKVVLGIVDVKNKTADHLEVDLRAI